MVSWKVFEDTMREVCLLVGQIPSKEQMQAIYRRICAHDEADFRNACEDASLLEELSRYRINYPSIQQHIIRHQTARIEREHTERKKREACEIRAAVRDDSLHESIKKFLKELKGMP
jgi:hypothetical protein